MRQTLLILILFVFCNTYAQKTVDKEIEHVIYGKAIEELRYNAEDILVDKLVYTLDTVYTKGHYEKGQFTRYYPSGKVLATGKYVKPMKADFFGARAMKKYGEWLFYSEDAKLNSSMNYVDDKEHGEYVNYHSNGKILGKGIYKDGNIIGVANLYFSNGKLHRAVKYSYGKAYNIVEFYDNVGKKIEFGTLKDGNGTLKIYDMETGKFSKFMTLEYGDPKKYDTKISKSPYGTIKVLTYKFDDGTTEKIERYLSDDLDGLQEFFYKSEELKKRGSYVEGVKNGKWQYFNEKGELIKEESFSNGILQE